MNDIFSLKIVPITPEFGMALKNFRIENEITAKAIVTEFSKSSSYITKLEKGDIKKIEADFLIKLCNFITKTDVGLHMFLSKIARRYPEYSDETKLIIHNIDTLLVDHSVSASFIADINTYMSNHEITVEQLVAKINANEDLINHPAFSTAPTNEWVIPDPNNPADTFIKLNIPFSYVENFLNGALDTIHYTIAEAILYALYRLGQEDEPRALANSKLQVNLIHLCVGPNIIAVNDKNMDNLFGGLSIESSIALQEITSALKLITTLTQGDGYGPKHIQQINANLQADLGFSFAYMSIDLEKLISKDKEKKKEFLKELKLLIEKYAQGETGLDIYE